MIEVDYGGRGHRTRLRDQEINCCVYGVPPGHVYKGVEEEGAGQEEEARQGGQSYSKYVLPPFPIPTRRRGKQEVERRKEKGAAPPSLSQFGLGQGGCAPPLVASPLPLLWAHEAQ